ncbi:MAG: FAD-binding protein [Gammaproteobacteria bacterium]|nr:FAD-binding protein [Gammaproteobacteria bacterium]
MAGIPYTEALSRYQIAAPRPLRDSSLAVADLLEQFHPDYLKNSTVELKVGANKGDRCHRDLARILQSDSRIDDLALAGVEVLETDVLVIGGGGAGCTAAITAAEQGVEVMLATKLKLGDSNTVMAEGGIQASIEPSDTPQMHYDDTLRAGHHLSDKALVELLAMSGPEVVRWLIQQGMQFEVNKYGDLLTRKPGGASAPRVVYYRDYTGLEMMRVLRESVRNCKVVVREFSPVVDLLSDESGHCAGAVLSNLSMDAYTVVRARQVILASGGIGRLHLNQFPTSNHFGATGDGLVLAYRLGAKLRDLDSFQYHPTGMAYPCHMMGSLITEGVRSAGVQILNALGERFVEELNPRDHVAAAIIRECAEGRGVLTEKGVGVWLDTPTLERQQPGIFERRFPKLVQRGKQGSVDPRQIPMLIYPTLHYQNGGVVIDVNGQSTVPGLYCVGEVSGGIHGRNRLMGNALLELVVFGRRAALHAAANLRRSGYHRVSLEHLSNMRRELMRLGEDMTYKGPQLFPDYANFDNDPDYRDLNYRIILGELGARIRKLVST